MAWSAPADPVGGTVITTAWAITNVTDNLRWLRLLTGNADPPGSAYVVVSTSTTGTSWQKVPADALAAGAALGNIATASITADRLHAGGTGSRVLRTSDGSTVAWGQILDGDIGTGQIGGDKLQDETITSSKIQAGTVATADMADNAITGAKLRSSSSDNSLRAVGSDHLQDAAVIARAIAAEAVTEIKLDAVNGPSDGQYLQYVGASGRLQWNFPLVAGGVPESMLDIQNGPSDDQVLTWDASSSKMLWTFIQAANVAAGQIAESHLDVNNGPTDGHLLAWNASASKLQWVSPPSGTAGIPSGLIAFFSGAAALAAATGWAAYTAANGRILACTGQVFSGPTFADAGNYGSSWDHAHTGNTWTGGTGGGTGTGATATGTTGTASGGNAYDEDDTGNGFNTRDQGHAHSIPSLGVTVSSLSVTGVTISGDTQPATWVPPIHSLPMGVKS